MPTLQPTAQIPVTVYWRPGCPYCNRMLRVLVRDDIDFMAINIWEDNEGAEALKAITGGNETVPTVVIGDMKLVNPPPRRVIKAVRTFGQEDSREVEDGMNQDSHGRGGRRVRRLLDSSESCSL